MNVASRNISKNMGATNGLARMNSALQTVGANVSTNVRSLSSGVSGIVLGFLVLLVLISLFAIYYKTVGYYIQVGWEKLQHSRRKGEHIELTIPGGGKAHLRPIPSSHPHTSPHAKGGILSDIEKDITGAIDDIETDVETALGITDKQVFNVSRNVYTFSEAEPLCRAFGAELASYDQVKDAYKAGADWCNYGWSKGQLALYPTQKGTYEKLQHGSKDLRDSCGRPGVNGGYFSNADERFGVNCYGKRPAQSAIDEQNQASPVTEYDREVSKFKSELDTIAVNPWNAKQWSA
jgi:hypothetical protein